MSNTLTFTGTDSSSIAFGAGGTVAYIGTANSWTAGVKQTFAPNATTAGINVGSLAGQPSAPANGDLVYNTSANALQAYINSAWVSLGAGGGGGITTLNTLTAATQTFAVGTTGTDFAISSATSTHTFNLPDASATARGVVTTGTQTFAGAKTFGTATTTFNLAASTGTAIAITGTGSTSTAQMTFSGGTMNWINFGLTGSAAPTTTAARSVGTKIVISSNFSAGTTLDDAIGYESTTGMWLSSRFQVRFHPNSSTTSAGQFEYSSSVRGLNLTASGTDTIPQLLFSGSGIRWINMGTGGITGFSSPSLTARSDGTKFVIWPNFSAGTTLDDAIGYASGAGTWFTSRFSFTFYTDSSLTPRLTINSSGLTLAAGANLVLSTSGAGTRIGTGTSQLLSFWNKTPIVQPTTGITGATRVGGAGTTVTTTDTYGGYTIAQIAAALINTGILA
jgi:hypothetical protein